MPDNATGHAGQGLALPCVVTVTRRKRPVKVQSAAGLDRAEAACYPLERDIDPVAEVDHELHQNTAPVLDRHRPFICGLGCHLIQLLE